MFLATGSTPSVCGRNGVPGKVLYRKWKECLWIIDFRRTSAHCRSAG